MSTVITELLSFALPALFIVCLIVGLTLSSKHSFKEGIVFFLLMLVLELMSMLNYIFIDQMISARKPLFGLSTVELVALLGQITICVKLIAFIILIRGLYRMWKLKGN